MTRKCEITSLINFGYPITRPQHRRKGRKCVAKNTKYETHVLPHLQSVESWILEGLDEERIAQRLGVSSRTFKKYKEEHKELETVLSLSRDTVLAEVEKALLKKARGYTYVETKTVDKGDKVEVTTTEKEMPPDLSAISFLLRNYCPEKWSDKPTAQKEQAQSGGVVILPDILETDEERGLDRLETV